MPKPYILDIDCSSDDYIGLLFIASEPECDIKAVTVAATGEVSGPEGARNTAMFLNYLDRGQTPVAYGADKPIGGKVVPFPDFLIKAMNNLFADKNMAPNPNPKISADAVALMKKVLQESPEKVTIVATGPLTNIAHLIHQHAELAQTKIEKIVIMGGAIHVPGNLKALHPQTTNLAGECNIAADPLAAKLVIESDLPIVLVPLDATNQVPMTMAFYNSLRLSPNADHQLMYLFLKSIYDHFGEKIFTEDFYLWDPLAVMISVNPVMATGKPAAIKVNLETSKTTVDPEADVAKRNVLAIDTVLEPKTVLTRLVDVIARRLNPKVDVDALMVQKPLMVTALQGAIAHAKVEPAIHLPVAKSAAYFKPL